ncbi:hypothetical protein [uncultured Clostridium sp.]|uniref:hypothetical protein n=1 Tax=uncultured Clostridium sp. TaxID=59620 RepID=UPI0026F3DB1A|nr:hypothetical protein [uncultured Clostridium sp.]
MHIFKKADILYKNKSNIEHILSNNGIKNYKVAIDVGILTNCEFYMLIYVIIYDYIPEIIYNNVTQDLNRLENDVAFKIINYKNNRISCVNISTIFTHSEINNSDYIKPMNNFD